MIIKAALYQCYFCCQGRLNEIMSQMRMQNLAGTTVRPEVGYQIDDNIQQEIKQVSCVGITMFMNLFRAVQEKVMRVGLNQTKITASR